MHIFDYTFLDEGLLPAEIVNLTATIAAFNVGLTPRFRLFQRSFVPKMVAF